MTDDLFGRGSSEFETGDYKAAARFFIEAVQKDQTDHRSWNALGVSYAKLGKRENAIKCIKRAIALDSSNQKYRDNLQKITGKSQEQKSADIKKYKLTDYLMAAAGAVILLIIVALAGAVMAGAMDNSNPNNKMIGNEIVTSTPPLSTPATTLPPTLSLPPTTTPQPIIAPANPVISPPTRADLKFHFIDVGQGDSILIQAGGKNMLVDAGPTDAGSKVASYLRNAGVNSLDFVVATHPHEDHIGGMTAVLSAFPVSKYIDSGETTTTATYKNVMQVLANDKTPYSEVKRGDLIPFASGISVKVLGPAKLTGDLNEDAIVLEITDGTVKTLLTGDSTTWAEPAQILKVPHHGSSTGSSYPSKVNPKVAVISVGAGNPYGHPAATTLSTLAQVGATTYRTDQDGTVIITTDGNTWNVQTVGTNNVPSTSKTSPVVSVKSNLQTTNPRITKSSAGSAPCDCTGPDLNCKDFAKGQAQVCFDYCKSQGYGDIFKLDRNKDGKVCQ